MNGKGDRARSVHKDKYDVKYDLAFSKTNPYTDEELDRFIKQGWITQGDKEVFNSKKGL